MLMLMLVSMLVALLMCVVRFVAWHKDRILMGRGKQNIKNKEKQVSVFYLSWLF